MQNACFKWQNLGRIQALNQQCCALPLIYNLQEGL